LSRSGSWAGALEKEHRLAAGLSIEQRIRLYRVLEREAVGEQRLDVELLNLLPRWSDDPVVVRKILSDNPARLYQF